MPTIKEVIIFIFFTLLMGRISYLAGKQKGINQIHLLVLVGLIYCIYINILY